MQVCSLQEIPVCVFPTGVVGQSFPPFAGAGLEQVLVWVMVPPEQVAEHVPFTQSDHPPSTVDGRNIDGSQIISKGGRLLHTWVSAHAHGLADAYAGCFRYLVGTVDNDTVKGGAGAQ